MEGSVFTVKFLDCYFTRLSHYKKDFKSGQRVRLHIGTNEIIGRITFTEGDEIKRERAE
jgi:hypothetical protein